MVERKKELMIVVVVILLVVNLINFFFLANITGSVITSSSSGTASICINYPPQITAISSQTATSGTAFSLQVSATDAEGDNLTYSDNTSLFAISSSGLISFTPTSSNVGVHNISITVAESSSCTSNEVSTTFLLTISVTPTPTTEAPSAGAAAGGGGGGGGGAAKPIKLDLSTEITKVVLNEKQKLDQEIEIENNGDVDLIIEIENPLEDVLYVTPLSFSLPPGQSAKIYLVINPYEKALPGIYSGELTITANSGARKTVKTIPIIIEIESEEVLFDSSLFLSKSSLLPGEELKATITLFNLRKIIPANVELIYTISDLKNNVIYEEKETIELGDQASFLKTFPIKKELAAGQYLLAIKIISGESFATTTEMFTVEKVPSALAGMAAPIAEKPFLVLSIPLLLIAILIVVVVLFFSIKKLKKSRLKQHIIHHKTIVKRPVINVVKRPVIKQRIVVSDRREELRKKLLALKEGYELGHIREDNYKKANAKIREIMNRIV